MREKHFTFPLSEVSRVNVGVYLVSIAGGEEEFKRVVKESRVCIHHVDVLFMDVYDRLAAELKDHPSGRMMALSLYAELVILGRSVNRPQAGPVQRDAYHKPNCNQIYPRHATRFCDCGAIKEAVH